MIKIIPGEIKYIKDHLMGRALTLSNWLRPTLPTNNSLDNYDIGFMGARTIKIYNNKEVDNIFTIYTPSTVLYKSMS